MLRLLFVRGPVHMRAPLNAFNVRLFVVFVGVCLFRMPRVPCIFDCLGMSSVLAAFGL